MPSSRPPVAPNSRDSEIRPSVGREEGMSDRLNAPTGECEFCGDETSRTEEFDEVHFVCQECGTPGCEEQL